jgi:hypothetical protein
MAPPPRPSGPSPTHPPPASPPAAVATAPPTILAPPRASDARPAPAPTDTQIAGVPAKPAAQPQCQPYASRVDFAGRAGQVHGLACRDAAGKWWLMNQRTE